MSNDANANVILPPPDIKAIVLKTAAFTAKNSNPSQFEDKIRQRQATDNRFSFINEDDAYHAYYADRVEFYKKGGVDEEKKPGAAVTASGDASASVQQASTDDSGMPTVAKPRPYEFINTERPPMAPVDHDILKLTALFTARMGRGFTNDLSAREKGNYQFEFLAPSHSLFGYFNRLVEQYTKVFMAPAETVQQLERQAGYTKEFDPLLHTTEKRKTIARREITKGMHNRVEWEKYENARKEAEDTAAEEERVAFASIDWQDFVVVSTVEFTENDTILDLPPPMSRKQVENMTMAQKKMAAMIMEGKDVAQAAVESGTVSKEAAEMEMEMSDDEADKLTARVFNDRQKKIDSDAARAQQQINNGPIKIRTDYVPKAQRGKKVATTKCTICGLDIPETEMAEHLRIELLDPKWKEKQLQAEQRRSAVNVLPAGDTANTLKQIAAKRPDIFTTSKEKEEAAKRQEAEEQLRRKEREKVVWDGFTSSAISTAERFGSNANLDQQIAALHKAKGVAGPESNIGPKITPASGEAEAAVSAPNFINAPGGFSGATLSAAPNPQAQPGYQQQQQQQYYTGQARPAEQSTDSDKRQKQ